MNIRKQETSYIKAIAILMVISTHILGTYFPNTAFSTKHVYFRSLLGIEGVFLFLFLSGYGMYKSFCEKGLTYFINKKVNSVFLPYWVVTLLFFILFKPASGPQILLKNLLCIDYDRVIDGTMWYMSFYALWLIAFFFLFSVQLPDFIRLVFLFVIGWYFQHASTATFSACAWQFQRNAFSLPLGVLCAYISQHFPLLPKKKKYVAIRNYSHLFFLFVCLLALYLLYKQGKDTIAAYTIFGFLLLLFLHLLNSLFHFENIKMIYILGSNSYYLYLIEGKLFTLVNTIVGPSQVVILRFMIYIICCLLTILLNYYSSRIKTMLQAKITIISHRPGT